MDVDKVFDKVYKGGMNFMTPNLVMRGVINPRFVYEISTGRGIHGERIFGITILGLTSKKKVFKANKLNALVYSQGAAFEYVRDLTNQMKQRY